jgi:hypothetical protein
MDHESIGMVERQVFAELLSRPFRRRMIGHVYMQNPPRTNLHRYEDVDHPKSRGDGNEEIACNDGLRMVVNERRPTLVAARTATWIGAQVSPHGSRRHLDSEFNKQFVGDALLAPDGILSRESAVVFAQVWRQGGTAKPSRLPFPKLPECIAVPFDEGCRFDDDQRAAPFPGGLLGVDELG